MEYGLFAIGGVILLSLAALIMRSRQTPPEPATEHVRQAPPPPQTQLAKLRNSKRFWGFKVESHCRASSRLAGRQFTLDERIPIPVEGCESPHCDCCLVGLPERRALADRRTGRDRRRSIRMEGSDRRTDMPRRKSDSNSWVAYSHL
ncbi:MAG: hypothetical protein KDJ27_00235 [Gammaproteobacteria bacterium]|nr:hypothetical protein [Gammaproteobacteria bacterium]